MIKQLVLTPKTNPVADTEMSRVIGVRYIRPANNNSNGIYVPFTLKELDTILNSDAEDFILADTDEAIMHELCLRYPSPVPGGSRPFQVETSELPTEEYLKTEERWKKRSMRRRGEDTHKYHDCYVILSRPYLPEFATIQELERLTADYNSVYVDPFTLRNTLANSLNSARIDEDAAIKWMREHNFTATKVEKYELIRVKYDPHRVAELDYAQAKREYDEKMATGFSDEVLLELVKQLGSFDYRKYYGLLENVVTHTKSGWSHWTPKVFESKKVLALIDIRRRLFGNKENFDGDTHAAIAAALKQVHGVMAEYRREKKVAIEKAGADGVTDKNAWRRYLKSLVEKEGELAKWLIATAHRLRIPIPPRPKPPALPAHKRKKGNNGSRQEGNDQAAD